MKRRRVKKSRVFLVIIFIVIIGIAGYIFYQKKNEEKRIAEIKKGWYIEVVNDYINVRDEANSTSVRISKVKKGEVYKVLDLVNKKKEKECYWYHIELKNGETGYVCNPKGDNAKIKYLNDFNDPNDLYTPKISYKESVYKVSNIDSITYDHLDLWDDHDDYKVTHKVYHEKEKCDSKSDGVEKYWIKYTITDGTDKSASTTQRIEFSEKPEESKVLNFCTDYKKDDK